MEDEPVGEERIRKLIVEELNDFGVKQGDSIKKVEELNADFVKNYSNSLPHRAEGNF